MQYPQAQHLPVAATPVAASNAVDIAAAVLGPFGMPGWIAQHCATLLAQPGAFLLFVAPDPAELSATLPAVIRLAAGGAGVETVAALSDSDDVMRALAAVRLGKRVIATMAGEDSVIALRTLRALRVDRQLLSDALGMVVVQRMAQRLCADCSRPVQAHGSVSALLGFDSGAVVHQPQGCAACNDTGYAGTIGVFEAIRVDPVIARLFVGSGDPALIARHAFLTAPTLGSAARALVRDGVIPAEEGIRLSRPSRPQPVSVVLAR